MTTGEQMKRFLIALLIVAAAAASQAAEELHVQKKYGVKYVTGGMTSEQRKLFEQAAPKYPVQLYFHIEGSSQPITGVKVVARDVKDDVVLEVESEGPLLFFDTTGGRYTIEAEYKGEKISFTKDLVGRRYLVLEYKFHGS
jgi:hypothetical protein